MKRFINKKTGTTHFAARPWAGSTVYETYCGRTILDAPYDGWKPGKSARRCKRCLLSAETTRFKKNKPSKP